MAGSKSLRPVQPTSLGNRTVRRLEEFKRPRENVKALQPLSKKVRPEKKPKVGQQMKKLPTKLRQGRPMSKGEIVKNMREIRKEAMRRPGKSVRAASAGLQRSSRSLLGSFKEAGSQPR